MSQLRMPIARRCSSTPLIETSIIKDLNLPNDGFERRAHFRLVPHSQRSARLTQNVHPPSHYTARHLVPLFCIFCRQDFCAEVHLSGISMGKHIAVTTFFELSAALSDPMHCVQTFNSLSQSPCTVVAYMIATCNGSGGFLILAYPGLVFSSL
jgi:hypothetical protein